MAEKIRSYFIDESVDFGPYDSRSPYYYVSVDKIENTKQEDTSAKERNFLLTSS